MQESEAGESANFATNLTWDRESIVHTRRSILEDSMIGDFGMVENSSGTFTIAR
jgi:hypothetical protein